MMKCTYPIIGKVGKAPDDGLWARCGNQAVQWFRLEHDGTVGVYCRCHIHRNLRPGPECTELTEQEALLETVHLS